jgi:pSer/pThr/pTyr-binding forkhead associated (FHA) protein
LSRVVIGRELQQGTPLLSGEYGSERIEAPLVGAVTRIGRGVSADVLLDHPTVSRRHALVVRREETLVLLDDRSMNGTWLNGERISEAVLSDGDRIQLGAVELSFRFAD